MRLLFGGKKRRRRLAIENRRRRWMAAENSKPKFLSSHLVLQTAAAILCVQTATRTRFFQVASSKRARMKKKTLKSFVCERSRNSERILTY